MLVTFIIQYETFLICRFFERFVASTVDWYSVIEVQYSIADVVLKPTPQNIQLLME